MSGRTFGCGPSNWRPIPLSGGVYGQISCDTGLSDPSVRLISGWWIDSPPWHLLTGVLLSGFFPLGRGEAGIDNESDQVP